MPKAPSGYILNVDAMRAVSILAVLAFHARYLAAGWIGVWVFFVISGFLITRSLLGLAPYGLRDGLRTFYIRRSLRIWPAYYLFLAVGSLAVFAGGLHQMRDQIAWCAFYLANLMPLFGIDDGGRVFGHLWSLAVEEQYYLVIAPLVLLLGARRCIPLFIALIFLTPAVRAVGYDLLLPHYGAASPHIVKSLTIFQIDSFVMGGLVAIFEREIVSAPKGTTRLAIATVTMLCAIVLVTNYYALGINNAHGGGNLDRSMMNDWRLSPTSFGIAMDPFEFHAHVWLYTILAALSTMLLISIIRIGSSFEFRTLNKIGKVSYGMYLYHVPMVAVYDQVLLKLGIAKISPAGIVGFFALAYAVYLVSLASFRWIESPILEIKKRVGEHPQLTDVSDMKAAAAPTISSIK